MLTLFSEIKRKLIKKNFNNEYKMLTKLSCLLQSDKDAQFMCLTHECYTLHYNEIKFLFDFLMCVKVLKECIDLMNV